jgi:predicted nucleotidyltransferase
MIELIQKHRAEIESICRTYRVRRMELFGSAARGDFDPLNSDIDLFIEFEDLGWQGSFKRYIGLKLALEDLLGLTVDLVESGAVTNPYFSELADKDRRPLYAA